VVEAVIEAVRINVVNDQHVVILKEMTGPRVVPIWIGPDVAHAIAIVLRGDEVSRPLTTISCAPQSLRWGVRYTGR
jgi:bifunctional DNase/RNase